MSDSVQPYGLLPASFLCPWDSSGKDTGVDSHCLLQGLFLTQGSNPGLLHWQAESFPVRHEGLDPREFPSMDIIFLSVHKMVSILKLSGKKMSQSQLRRKDNACLSMEGLIFI